MAVGDEENDALLDPASKLVVLLKVSYLSLNFQHKLLGDISGLEIGVCL